MVLGLETRRFRCFCCGEVFTEPNHIFGPKRRWTERLRKYLGERASHHTVSLVAKEERVSESLVRRSFAEETRYQWGIDEQRPKASRVIGLDEFSIKKRTFDTTVSDLDERKVLGIVEGCGNPTYHNY